MKNKIYLDNAASTPLCESFLNEIQEYAEKYYNPSSINENSMELRMEIEGCREKVAKLINADPEEIYFTSGATESCAIAIDGFLEKNPGYWVVSSNIEHPAVMNNCNIDYMIKCNEEGLIDPSGWNDIDIKALYCFMLVNNEIGTIQPIKQISEYVHKNNGVLFSDLTSAVGKISIDVKDLGIDIACFSGHKIGSLKGVGVLYVNKDIDVCGVMYGHQEGGVSPGTYNYLAIKSLDVAVDNIDLDKQKDVSELKNYLKDKLLEINPNIKINGSVESRIAGNLNICIPNISIDNQQLVSLLDMDGFIVSAASACASGDAKPSHVLKAIGLSDEEVNRSIRITLDKQNTKMEIDDFINCLNNIIILYKE